MIGRKGERGKKLGEGKKALLDLGQKHVKSMTWVSR